MVLLLTAACGKKRTSASAPRSTPSAAAAKPAKPGTTQVGLASWYGEPYHGRRAANGEIYDMNQLTAAHRTLPFDTLVNVLNLDNQREVQVRINDRGPFVGDRIIDLSRAAAQQISMIGPGTAKVRLKVIGTRPRDAKAPSNPPAPSPPASTGPTTEPQAPLPESAPDESPDLIPAAEASVITPPARPAGTARPGTGYAVQIGAFSESKAAEKLQRRMASRYGSAYIENVRSDKGMLYRVRVGPKPTMTEAAQVAASLKRENFEPLVVQVPIQN